MLSFIPLLPFIVVGRTARRASGGWLHASRGRVEGVESSSLNGLSIRLSSGVLLSSVVGNGMRRMVCSFGGGTCRARDLVDRVVVFKGRVWTRLLALGLVL